MQLIYVHEYVQNTQKETERKWEKERLRVCGGGGVYQSLKGQASELIRFGRERSCCSFLCAQTQYKSFIMGRHRRGLELLLAWSEVPGRRKKERERKKEKRGEGGGGLSSNFIITLGVCHSCAVTLLFCCDGTDSSLWNSVKLSCLLIQSDIHGSPSLPIPPHLSLCLISFLIRGNMWFPSKCSILLEWFFIVDSLGGKQKRQTMTWGV